MGSAAWVQSERQQAAQFIEQEVDEFGYSVRNDLEWLDEHMSEVVFGRGGMYVIPYFLLFLPLYSFFHPSRSVYPSHCGSVAVWQCGVVAWCMEAVLVCLCTRV